MAYAYTEPIPPYKFIKLIVSITNKVEKNISEMINILVIAFAIIWNASNQLAILKKSPINCGKKYASIISNFWLKTMFITKFLNKKTKTNMINVAGRIIL